MQQREQEIERQEKERKGEKMMTMMQYMTTYIHTVVGVSAHLYRMWWLKENIHRAHLILLFFLPSFFFILFSYSTTHSPQSKRKDQHDDNNNKLQHGASFLHAKTTTHKGVGS